MLRSPCLTGEYTAVLDPTEIGPNTAEPIQYFESLALAPFVIVGCQQSGQFRARTDRRSSHTGSGYDPATRCIRRPR